MQHLPWLDSFVRPLFDLNALKKIWSEAVFGDFNDASKRLLAGLLLGLPYLSAAPTPRPAVQAPQAFLFSASPTSEEITRAKVFEEPLVPLGHASSPAENLALAQAIETYLNLGKTEAVEPFRTFLKDHPASAWRASLLMNIGLTYRHTGFFSRALESWEEAWDLSKGSKDPKAVAVGDRAGAELADLDARLGRSAHLETLLKELAKRPLRGSAASKAQGAQEGLDRIKTTPERNFRCGPLSLASIRKAQGRPEPKLLEENGAPSGTSLLYNQKLGQKYALNLQMAKRESGAGIPLPAVMHWKSGHFAALVKLANGRYLMQDPTFGDDLWITQAAIEDESSGYALVPKGPLPTGWRPVPDAEGMTVMGRGGAAFGDPNATGKGNTRKGSSCPNNGMAGYSFHSLLASLYITDIPVGYAPPKGPAVEFLVSYSQKEANQPQTFTYSNLGPKWTFDFLAYIQDDPTVVTDAYPFSMSVKAYERGGGAKTFTFQSAYQRQPPSNPSSGPSSPSREDQSVLVRSDLNRYTRIYPDGRQEFYEHPDGARVYPRKIFLTKVVDRLGAALNINYDDQHRVTTLVDALGQTTTLSYGSADDPLKITQVMDPFGRAAKFEYNAQGQLLRITDVVGITSEFAYGPTLGAPGNPVDFVNALTTPYGTTQFFQGGDSDGTWIKAQDPLGGISKLEFKRHPWSAADYSTSMPREFLSRQPGGTFYWDSRAMALYPDNRDKAHYTRWLVGTDGEGSIDVPHSIKRPENLDFFSTWYAYPGQSSSNYAGTLNLPSRIIQTTGDGTFVESTFGYNDYGRPTQTTDPLGRQTTFKYADNQLDLLEVRHTSHGQNHLLASYTYNANHLPLTAKDASGQVSKMVYSAAGQLTSITNPKNQAVSLVYNSLGQLTDVNGLGGNHSGFTYDPVGRVKTVTNPENEVVSMEYDNLDRPTKVTYPDGTYEQMVYDRLDISLKRDRGGKWTSLNYNALRQLVEVQDALGRSTFMDWCSCGSLDSLTDPLGRTTFWLRNLDGRVLGKILPDRSGTEYGYDALGRVNTT